MVLHIHRSAKIMRLSFNIVLGSRFDIDSTDQKRCCAMLLRGCDKCWNLDTKGSSNQGFHLGGEISCWTCSECSSNQSRTIWIPVTWSVIVLELLIIEIRDVHVHLKVLLTKSAQNAPQTNLEQFGLGVLSFWNIPSLRYVKCEMITKQLNMNSTKDPTHGRKHFHHYEIVTKFSLR